jgi:alkylated DNA repair dioxygenase AlkB
MPSTTTTMFESTGAKLTKCNLDAAEYEMIRNAIAEIEGKLEECPPIELYGKVARQQRHVGFFADPAVTHGYFYSRSVAKSIPPGESIKALLGFVNKEFESGFNGVLVNYYPDGGHYISDHSDSEAGLDPSGGVVIASAGATRTMHFKRTKSPPIGTANFKYGAYKIPLTDGSLIAMRGTDFQKAYTHGIPKEAKASGPRWSFTFRHHTGENEAPMIAAAEKTLARIAEKMAAAEREVPAAKRAKRE